MSKPDDKRKSVERPAAHRPVSLRFIADKLHLSPATISAVINDAPPARTIPQSTKDRILRAAREYNYEPNYMARSLRQRRSFTVAIVVPEISEGYVAELLSGIEEPLVQKNYFYVVGSHRGKEELLQTYPQRLKSRAAEGFIFINTAVGDGLGLPVVAISARSDTPGVTNILLDNGLAGRLAIEHLVTLGHRELAFFQGHAGSADTGPRWEAICRACEKFGVPVRPELTVQLGGRKAQPEPSTPEEGYFYARKILEAKRPFTALVAFNDISAIGAISAFRDAGLRIPADVSVIGFDDIMAAGFLNPRLTTVRQPLHRMGELAAQTLLDRIEDPATQKPHTILVEPELVVRESTSKVRSSRARPAR